MRIHYRELGSGPPLLLVHGLMTTSYSWRYVYAPLAKHFRVVAPDLPGAGRSDRPDRPHTARSLARFVAELQAVLGIRGCAVVGNSLGGYVCMRLALDDPAAMSRVVAIHPPAFPLARLYALRVALGVPGSRRLLDWLIARAPERWAHRNVHYWFEELKSREEAREYALTSRESRRAFIRYLHEAMAPGALREFVRELGARRFPVPLRLVYARRDPMVPPSVGARLARLVPDAELVWLDECSHFAQVDQPERVAEIIGAFCR